MRLEALISFAGLLALGVVEAQDVSGGHGVTLELGKQYERLAEERRAAPTSTRREIVEAFWYGCAHCYEFEPHLELWRQKHVEEVDIVRVPAIWSPSMILQARAYYTAELLGKADVMHMAFFTEIHKSGNALDTQAKLTEFFGRFGVDATTFAATMNSPAVDAKIKQAFSLYSAYKFKGVPSVVVDGTYKTDAFMAAGGSAALIAIVDKLFALEDHGSP